LKGTRVLYETGFSESSRTATLPVTQTAKQVPCFLVLHEVYISTSHCTRSCTVTWDARRQKICSLCDIILLFYCSTSAFSVVVEPWNCRPSVRQGSNGPPERYILSPESSLPALKLIMGCWVWLDYFEFGFRTSGLTDALQCRRMSWRAELYLSLGTVKKRRGKHLNSPIK
jgi:hypothetical protein